MFDPLFVRPVPMFARRIALATWFVACAAHAGDRESMFMLRGFGTLGATYSSLHTADYAGGPFEPYGAGASRNVDFGDDSRIGVQLTAKFTPKLSALVQVVSHRNYDNSFTPTLEWANVNYAFTPDLNVRVGRIELPTFLTSDYREVGYANAWVRVPPEFYDIAPITNSDGVDSSYRMHIGAVTNTVHLIYGRSSFHAVPGPLRVEARGIFGAFDTIEYRALSAHLGYLRAHVSMPSASDRPAVLYSAAASVDMERWFVLAEIARATVADLTPGYIAGYATAGFRVGKLTPYMTYAVEHSLGRPVLTGNLNNGQRAASCGVRWDFAKNVDLKVQYDRVWTPADSIGLFMNEQPGFRLGSGTHVVTAALDFVF